MTEKECRQALKTIISRGGDMTELIYWSAAMLDEVDLLDKLIAEYFKKEKAVKPFDESKQDKLCPKCGAYISFDALNQPIEEAPNYCRNCGQKFDWSGF